MTQLTRFIGLFAVLVLSVGSIGASEANEDVGSAKDALSAAQNRYYEELRASGKKGNPAALKERIIAPAAQNLGRAVQKKHDDVVKRNMKIDRNSMLPEMPDASADASEDDADDAAPPSGPEESYSASDQKVIETILNDDESSTNDGASTRASVAPSKGLKKEPESSGVRAVPAGRVSRPAPQKTAESEEDNSLSAPPKEGEGVKVMEF